MILSEFLYLFLMFFVPMFLIIIALGQLAERDKDFVHYVFAFSFIGQGLWEIQIIIYSTKAFPDLYGFAVWLIPFSYVVTLLLFIRYVWIFSVEYRFYRRHIFLFIPSVMALFFCLFVIFVSGEFSLNHFEALPFLSKSFYSLPLISRLFLINILLSKIYLFGLMLFMLYKFYKISRYSTTVRLSRVFNVGYIFAILIATMTAICIFGDLFSMSVVRGSVLVANVFICAVYVVSRRHPSYNRMLKIEIEKVSYVNSYIKGLDSDRVIANLYSLMREEKAFADEDISLKKLADELDITTHQLSQILNEKIKKNFNTFINEFRVEEAKTLLIEEPDRSILSISLAVGFNSYTTFCTTFSKYTGESPSNYRKRFLKGHLPKK
ncbi:MAG TPA: helix-turn-helix domain-containing protein [Spirochaetota bacterium]|nr:helix-turn-helix domain-containing protein [Spirochaetota bacterium]